MKKLLLTLFTMVLTIFFLNSYSQGNFSLHAGPSFPMGNFGDDDMTDDDSGGAGLGLNVGAKFLNTLNDKGLGLFVSADLLYNGLNSDVQDDMEDQYDEAEITFFKYINIPLMAGLNYTVAANDQVSLFGEVGLGADILKMTDMTIEIDSEEAVMSFEMSTQLGLKFGGGIVIDDKYIIGLDYYSLGEHKIKGKAKSNGNTEDMDPFKLEISALTLTLGMKF